MSYELISIFAVGTVLALGQIVGFLIAIRVSVHGFREIARTHKAIAGLVVQESEKVQGLLRA